MRFDRLVGLLAFVVAAAVLVVGGMRSIETAPGGPLPRTLGPVDDAETTRRFLDLYDRSSDVTYALTGTFVRLRGEETGLESSWREVQSPPDRLIAGLGSVRGTFRGEVIECGRVDGERVCTSGAPDDPALDRARGLQIVEQWTRPGGPYALARAESREIAGEDTECFVLRLRPGWTVGSFGEHSEYCYADDGIPLLVITARAETHDLRTAREVTRRVAPADFLDLLS